MLRTSEDTLKLRLAARAKIEDATKPPHLLVVFVDPRTGEHDAREASFGGKKLVRRAQETLEDFQDRVCRAMPARGGAVAVFM
jgi:hypothetical protein